MKLSPAPKKTSIWSTGFGKGKYEKIQVNRITNARAAKTVDTTDLPDRVMSAAGFMRSFVVSGFSKLSSGAHGEVYSLDDTFKLVELHALLQNKITHVTPAKIPATTKVIIKVIAIPEDEREMWDVKDVTTLRRGYLRLVTERTVKKDFKIPSGEPLPINTLRKAYVNIRKNFNTRLNQNTRQSYLREFQRGQRTESWFDVLRDGSGDAINHVHLVKAPAETIQTQLGQIQLKASDVVPDFYFAGSSRQHGVYIIAMGVAQGSAASRVKRMPPTLVANIEKALVTLAAAGVEHGDLHSGNIMVAADMSVKVIDFGMTSILPETYRTRATAMITQSVSSLLRTGSWPENSSNNFWYNPQNGIMRYMNSYMSARHGKNFSWYNPSGKFLLYAKTHADKNALDHARFIVWRTSIRRKPVAPRRIVLNYSNL